MIGGRSVARLAGGCLIGALVVGTGLPGTLPPAAAARRQATTTTVASTTLSAGPTTSAPPTTTAPTTTAAPAPPITDPFQPVAPIAAATAHVSIVDYAFSPSTITVTAGTTVTWTNTGAAVHSVTSDTGAFDSSPGCPGGPCIDPGASFSHVFSQPGSYSYHCRVHSTMTATVIVTAATTPTTTTTTTASAPTTAGSSESAAAAGAPTTTNPDATGAQLAFTGTPADVAWIALGGLLTIALGLALRPRRRPFPIPVPTERADRRSQP